MMRCPVRDRLDRSGPLFAWNKIVKILKNPICFPRKLQPNLLQNFISLLLSIVIVLLFFILNLRPIINKCFFVYLTKTTFHKRRQRSLLKSHFDMSFD